MKIKSKVKDRLLRLSLIIGATVLIMLLLPGSDHQSYSYELNQPWRYPLLTAEFDMPILRDSASVRVMRDSIDRTFVPIVKRDAESTRVSEERFARGIAADVSPQEARLLESLLHGVLANGVVHSEVYAKMKKSGKEELRVAGVDNGAGMVETIDASQMMSPAIAFHFIDSVYSETFTQPAPPGKREKVARALNAVLQPNVEVDTAANTKFLAQEYLMINAALGVIKAGQRIVDRGEIVTPQVFTNLNTYMTMLDKNRSQEKSDSYFLIGQVLYILMCFSGLYLFLGIFRPVFFNSVKKMTFLMIFITAFVIFSVLMFEYFRNGIYYVPFAAVPVVILVFFDSRTAIFSLLVTVMLAAVVAVYPFQFIFLEVTAGMTAAFSIHQLSQRSQLLRTALITFVTYCLAYFTIRLLTDGNLGQFEWRVIGAFAVNGVLLSFVYILILVEEKLFGFTSTVTLVELSDINNPLLRRLAEEAPGTFQHSMQVSMLAAEAARAIGANTQLVRTGALYHDIGKLESPIFFTENQHGVNPHAGLKPETSAQKIISHVTAGLALAGKSKLPAEVKNFIAQHHGKSVTRYFYNTAVNENPDRPVDKSRFTYPGPNPQTRETAILMMADAVEAASRSLKEYSSESINALVDKIIDTQQADGLYNESPISFRDIQEIKDTFKKRLATIYHARIAYPELNRHEGAPHSDEAAPASGKAASEATPAAGSEAKSAAGK